MKLGAFRVRVQGGGLVLTVLAATLVVDGAPQAGEGPLSEINPKKPAVLEPRPSVAPALREADLRKEPRLLASMAYPSGDAQRLLALWGVHLFPDGLSAHFGTTDYPGGAYPPNIALLLVESPWENPTKNKVVWVSYRYLGREDSLRADVVWHAGCKEAFVSMWQSGAGFISLEVHRVDPTKSLTDLSFEKFARKEDEWNKPDYRLYFARLFKELPRDDLTELKGRGVLLERDHLLFHGQRDAAKALPVYFRLNLENKEWSEVILQENKITPKQR